MRDSHRTGHRCVDHQSRDDADDAGCRLHDCCRGCRWTCAARRLGPVRCARLDVRAAGRAYDGAPPVIPHALIGACITCHDDDGSEIAGIGVAPASPHGSLAAAGAFGRCQQCHVPIQTGEVMVASVFTGLPQGAWKGGRATPGSAADHSAYAATAGELPGVPRRAGVASGDQDIAPGTAAMPAVSRAGVGRLRGWAAPRGLAPLVGLAFAS